MARMEEKRGVDKNLLWEPDGKRLMGRPRLKWRYNIKMELL